MSELSVFSIGFFVGAAALLGIGKMIAGACGGLSSYQPKNTYVATPEREMVLQSLYAKNVTIFEDKYILRNDGKIPNSQVMDHSLLNAKLEAIHVKSMFEAMSDIEPIAFVAKQKHEPRLKKLRSIISDITTQLDDPVINVDQLGKIAKEGESIIRKVTNDSHSLLARAEEDMALNVITDSMSSLGYRVNVGKTGINATKGQFSIRARVSAGRINLDTTSFSGISCQTEIQNIEKDLQERGLVLQRLCESHRKLPKDTVAIKDPFPLFGKEHVSTKKEVDAFLHKSEGLGNQHLQLLNRTLKENRLKI